MDLYEWFQHNCVYAPTKADRKIVRDIIATQYPNELEYIADHWGLEYKYVCCGSVATFALRGSQKGIQYSVGEFLEIFCWDDAADIAVDLDSIL